MQLVLEKRAERSNTIALVSPLIAIGLTIVTMSILFAILGKNPVSALGVYFIDPLTDSYSLQEIAVKATPLVMIAIGLSLCYLANVWNIGAEGQFLIGAVAGSWLAVKTQGTDAGLIAGAALARRACYLPGRDRHRPCELREPASPSPSSRGFSDTSLSCAWWPSTAARRWAGRHSDASPLRLCRCRRSKRLCRPLVLPARRRTPAARGADFAVGTAWLLDAAGRHLSGEHRQRRAAPGSWLRSARAAPPSRQNELRTAGRTVARRAVPERRSQRVGID